MIYWSLIFKNKIVNQAMAVYNFGKEGCSLRPKLLPNRQNEVKAQILTRRGTQEAEGVGLLNR